MTRPDYLAAAGLDKPKRGRPPLGPGPTRDELTRLYLGEGRSIRDAALILGCSKEAVHRALRAFGITSRPSTRTSRLAIHGVRELRRRVKVDGLRGAARTLGVAWATLRDYLKRHDKRK